MLTMQKNYDKAKDVLKKYHQEHLLNFYDELNNEEKEALINQICHIDFAQILNLYEASKTDEIIPHNVIKPLAYKVKNQLSQDEITYYEEISKDIILNNKYAVVTLAGGQGTRLGYKGPKGTFELDIKPKK